MYLFYKVDNNDINNGLKSINGKKLKYTFL